MPEAQDFVPISTRLQRIAETARNRPDLVFTSLAHHIDVDFLREAYGRTRKDGAVGVDGQTGAEYAQDLEGNLRDLLERFKSGRYVAPPVRRARIPKGDGRTRPLGIPSFEDKVLQRAVAMVLEAVYEQDFLPCSHGFRPGRSAHQALQTLRDRVMDLGGGWVLDVDIKGFFDNLVHHHLRQFLDRRVRDGVLRRIIHKWLKAGVMEDGALTHPEAGTPQGGVISPILANIYLHEVLDKWFHNEVLPHLGGAAFLIRYADDFVIVTRREEDARHLLDLLSERFRCFGLELHPEKTRLVRFRRPPRGRKPDPHDAPETFDLLGFTHYWGVSRKGYWVVLRKTARSRFRRALKAISDWCRRHRHLKLRHQHRLLSQKVRGHYSYYGVTPNGEAIARYLKAVKRIWFKWLRRRAQRRTHTWKWFNRMQETYRLPPPVVVHSIYRRRPAANPLR